MAKEIIWSERAVKAYNNIINYLLQEWSGKEAEQFIIITERILRIIAKNPKAFRELEEKHHHEALVTKHNLLIYEVKGNKIFILTIWDTRRNPRKKQV